MANRKRHKRKKQGITRADFIQSGIVNTHETRQDYPAARKKTALQSNSEDKRKIIQLVKAEGGSSISNVIQKIFIGVNEQVRDAYIHPFEIFEKVDLEHFSGRDWLLAEIDQFMHKYDRGYFIIEAEAGLGKTAFLAWLIKQRGYIHHFSTLSPGLEGLERATKNLASQLILEYHLAEAENELPFPAGRSDYLYNLLNRAAQKRALNQKIVLVIDALDESGTPYHQNVLGLPKTLPKGVYILASQRPVNVTLQVESAATPRSIFPLKAENEQNKADMILFLRSVTTRKGIIQSLQQNRVTTDEFIQTLLAKSQGVWVYLYYVISDIENGKQLISALSTLPEGITHYYLGFLKQLRDQNDQLWYEAWLPLMATIAAARESLYLKMLMTWASLALSEYKVRQFLENLNPILVFQKDNEEYKVQFYHTSLDDFFHGRWEFLNFSTVEKSFVTEVIDQTYQGHNRIANHYLTKWGELNKGLPGLQSEELRKIDQGYGLNFLVHHLQMGKRYKEIHQLITAETNLHRSSWYEAKDLEGDLTGYHNDLLTAWNTADAIEKHNLNFQVWYSLIQSTLHSVSTNTRPEIVVALFENGIWTPERCLAYIVFMDSNGQQEVMDKLFDILNERGQFEYAIALARTRLTGNLRTSALLKVLPYLDGTQHRDLLVDLSNIFKSQGGFSSPQNSWFLDELTPHLFEYLVLQKGDNSLVSSQELEQIQGNIISNVSVANWYSAVREGYVRALSKMSQPEQNQFALDILKQAQQIGSDFIWSQEAIIASLAPFFSPEGYIKAFESIQRLGNEKVLSRVLTSYAPYFPPEFIEKSMQLARNFRDRYSRYHSLIYLAKRLEEEQKRNIYLQVYSENMPDQIGQKWKDLDEYASFLSDFSKLLAQIGLHDEAFNLICIAGSARAYQNKFPSSTFAEIAPSLPPKYLPELLEFVQGSDEHYSYALEQLAPYLSPELIKVAYEHAKNISDRQERILTIAVLAPYLTLEENQSLFDDLKAAAISINSYVYLSVAKKLHENIRPLALMEALYHSQRIQDFKPRQSIFLALYPFLPTEWQHKVIPELITIPDQESDIFDLLELLPVLDGKKSSEVAIKALDLIINGSGADEFEKILALLFGANQQDPALTFGKVNKLTDIIPYLPRNYIPQVLSFAHSLPMEGIFQTIPKVSVLGSLLPYLSEDQRAQEIETILDEFASLKVIKNLRQIIMEIGSYLSTDQLNFILETAAKLDTKYEVAISLGKLAPYLSADQILRALACAKQLPEIERYVGGGKSRPRLLALASLIPYLKSSDTDELIPQIIRNRKSFWQDIDQLCVLIRLLPYATADSRKTIIHELADFLTLTDEHNGLRIVDRTQPLTWLIIQLNTQEFSIFLPKLLDFSLKHAQADFMTGKNSEGFTTIDHMRQSILRSAISQWQSWAQDDPESSIKLLKETLHELATHPRPAFLTELSELIPLLVTSSGDKSALEIATAIQQITTWWQ